MLTKYSEFKNSLNKNDSHSTSFNTLNENVAQAKTYLKNRALKDKREKMGEPREGQPPVGLDAHEVKQAENDRDFLKIKDMLSNNAGYTYAFTKFFFEDLSETEPEQRHIELKNLYDTLKDMRQLLNQLPMGVDRYPTQKPTDDDKRTPYERLVDDLELIRGSKITNKWLNQLLSWQRAWFDKATPTLKEKLNGIAMAFDEFGKEPDGSKDNKKNKELQEYFFLKVRKYLTVGDLITSAENYVKSANNAGMSKFLQAISKVTQKYGEINGAEEVFNENNILVIEVRSFVANRDLNSNTSHCIANGQGSWDSYVGDNKYTKQYYIYDFNLPPSDIESVVGVTIAEGGKVSACHLKNDREFSRGLEDYMKKRKIPMKVLAPMSSEEIEKKKKRVIANKEIVKENITLEKCKQFFEEGADPNAGTGKPLQNSVKENNMEKTKFLLEMGANPNVGECIKLATNLNMIKLLVDHGSQMHSETFKSIMHDIDAVEYILSSGIDPNFDRGFPLRTAALNGNTEMINLLIKHGASIAERRYMVVKWALDNYNLEILKFLFKRMEQLGDPALKTTKYINDWYTWCKSSSSDDPKDSNYDASNKKAPILDYLQEYLDKYKK